MKRSATVFLQIVIVLIGIGVLTALLWEPNLEGRNVNSTFVQVYFHDPFLAYIYVAFIPFFVALYQAIRILGFIGTNKIFSQAAVNSLRSIKYCAISFIAFILGAEVCIVVMQRNTGEDAAGAIALGLFIMCVSAIIAVAAAVFQRVLQHAVDIKSENDLTV